MGLFGEPALIDLTRNRQSSFSPLSPFLSLPKYFVSEWSYAQYRIPSQKTHLTLSAGTSGGSLSDMVEDERFNVAWIKVPLEHLDLSSKESKTEFQLIALTYSGGWFRIALPNSTQLPTRSQTPTIPSSASHAGRATGRPRSSSGSIASGRVRLNKGKEKEPEPEKAGHACILQEFRRFGRWDGWG